MFLSTVIAGGLVCQELSWLTLPAVIVYLAAVLCLLILEFGFQRPDLLLECCNDIVAVASGASECDGPSPHDPDLFVNGCVDGFLCCITERRPPQTWKGYLVGVLLYD